MFYILMEPRLAKETEKCQMRNRLDDRAKQAESWNLWILLYNISLIIIMHHFRHVH